MRRLLPLFIALVAVFVCRAEAPVSAELAQGLEYNVKAAYVFNLANFTTWPATAFPSSSAPLRVCVAPPDPFGGALTKVFQNEMVGGHPVLVMPLKSIADARQCQVLFIGRNADGNGAIERAVAAAPVLTVGETNLFERRGGIIRFVIDQGRVRFDVNKAAAERAGIQFSSKVLQVARRVS